MRILYVAMQHGSYADRSHEVLVAEELAKSGHEVMLVTEEAPDWTKRPPPTGLKFLGPAPVNDAGAAERVAATLPEADVAFASSASGAPILAAWKRRTRRAAVTQVLDLPLWRLKFGKQAPWFDSWRPWFNALLDMDAVVCNTDQTASDLYDAATMYCERPPHMPPRATVYYGIDTEAADAATPIKLPGRSLGVKAACAAARLVFYKGYAEALNGLSLMESGKRPNYHVVGAGEDHARLVQQAAIQRVNAYFHGGVDDAAKYGIIKGSDFGLYLAWNPNIPSQFPMEAAYCGKPCIVADIPINRERFGNHGVYYVNPFDTNGVKLAVEAMVDDLIDTERCLDGAKEWIIKNRSFHSHAAGVLKVLQGAKP